MNNRVIPVIALAVILTLSGCAEFTGDDQPTETPTNETVSDIEYPDGFNESGVANASLATATHVTSLADSGSWQSVYEAEFTDSGETVTVNETRTIELTEDSQREWIVVNAPGANQEILANATETYRVSYNNGEPRYAYDAQGMDVKSAAYLDMYLRFLGGINFEQQSVTTEGGQTLITYTSTGLANGVPTEQDGQMFDEPTASFTVDDEGRIREFEFQGQIQQGENMTDVSFSVTVSDIGSTSLENPEWVADAREWNNRLASP